MNASLRKGISLLLCLGLAVSLSACSIIRNIKENAAREAETEIFDSPADENAVETYNAALKKTLESCAAVHSDVRFGVRDAEALSPDETGALTLLNAASKQLTGLIMAEKPGSESKTLPPDEAADTLRKALDAGDVPGLTTDRNYSSEKVTDEAGNELKDENGEAVTERYISDNQLKLTLRYYTEEVLREAYVDEEGNEVPAETERIPAADALIESVFGEAKDKAAILAQFDAIQDYLQVRDYTVSYTDCSVRGEIDLETGLLTHVTFEKNMSVKASVTGVGSLEKLGDFTVALNVNETTDYGFDFPAGDEDA